MTNWANRNGVAQTEISQSLFLSLRFDYVSSLKNGCEIICSLESLETDQWWGSRFTRNESTKAPKWMEGARKRFHDSRDTTNSLCLSNFFWYLISPLKDVIWLPMEVIKRWRLTVRLVPLFLWHSFDFYRRATTRRPSFTRDTKRRIWIYGESFATDMASHSSRPGRLTKLNPIKCHSLS